MDFAAVLSKTREHVEALLRAQQQLPAQDLEALREAAAAGRRALVASAQGFSHAGSPRLGSDAAMPEQPQQQQQQQQQMMMSTVATAPVAAPATQAAPVEDPFASFDGLAATVPQPLAPAAATPQFPSPMQPLQAQDVPPPASMPLGLATAAAPAPAGDADPNDPFAGL
jgi:hypothetical protein